ncbi:MAG: NifB/NifX family molybdenum-iron cluster-binding protein [Candidatus Omnitrophica bacterium]|nr:NifB/NifX family molybdenum-iron cluster-binding protein [Candidatus Omnitrophota bacterium]
MKICVTSQGDNLNSEVDSRFGRCQYFIIVDTDTLEFESLNNPYSSSMGGAGIQSGQFVADKGVKTVLTGNVGPNAFQTLHAVGIDIVTGISGTVLSAIEKFKSGAFSPASGASVDKKFGIQPKE